MECAVLPTVNLWEANVAICELLWCYSAIHPLAEICVCVYIGQMHVLLSSPVLRDHTDEPVE
jgi:hypothetical protein